MLKGLFIRQALMLVDLILALVIVWVAFLVTSSAFAPHALDTPEILAAGTADYKTPVRPTLDRAAYDVAVEAGLFGDAGKTAKDATPEPPPPTTETDTTLKLTLFGTASASPQDPLATAVIQDDGAATPMRTYYLNQKVTNNVRLVEVRHDSVVLMDPADNVRQVLRMDKSEIAAGAAMQAMQGGFGAPGGPPSNAATPMQVAGGPSRPTRGSAGGPGGRATPIKRDEVVKELSQMNFADLYSQVSPEMAKDASGKNTGITSQNIENIPLAQKFGFKNGDVIQSINGVTIDSEARALEVVNRYQNATTFNVGILRNGKPTTLVFRVE